MGAACLRPTAAAALPGRSDRRDDAVAWNDQHLPLQSPTAAIRQRRATSCSAGRAEPGRFYAEPGAWRDGVGIWPPGTLLATDAGLLEVITAPRDSEQSRHAIRRAGYCGERIVSLVSMDFPAGKAADEVGSDLFRPLGLNVDHVATGWGPVVQRRSSREPVERGDWSCFYTGFASLDLLNPGLHQLVRGGGERAWFSWPSIPRMEDLASDWIRCARPRCAAAHRSRDAAACLRRSPISPAWAVFSVNGLSSRA